MSYYIFVKLPVTFFRSCVKFIGYDAFRRCICDVTSGSAAQVEFYLAVYTEEIRFKLRVHFHPIPIFT
jgi:hypothetical protein